MKILYCKSNLSVFLTGFFILFLRIAQAQEFPVLKGHYIGQRPPGKTPEIFAPGIVSTAKNEVNSVFSEDGTEFYFSLFNPGTGYTIMVMKEEESGWTKPRVAPFSGKYSEVDMFITKDGNQFYFVSKRPIIENGPPSSGYQIWRMTKEAGSWVAPHHLGAVVNSGGRQLYPTLSRKGTIYFGSNRNGYGGLDLFRSRQVNGNFTEPENLGDSVNTAYDETDVWVAPDESYIIFTSVNRPEGFGSGDNYISFRKEDGSWTKARNMGIDFNSSSSDFCPMLSPDGKYFFFTSGRGGSDDIYWVDASVIEEFIPEK